MEIRKPCNLAVLYGHTHRICESSPELRFLRAVCAGQIEEALSFFHEQKLFGGAKCAVDAPYGRFEGLEGIRTFAKGWLGRFGAQAATVDPIVQTIAGGRVALEAVVGFMVNGAIEQVPFFLLADLRTPNTLDEARLYCHFSFVPNLQAYRKPMFVSAYSEVGDAALLTGAVREYFEALHHCPAVDVERVLGCVSEDCVFGGYERWGEPVKPTTRETLRATYLHMREYIPRCVGMRFETIVDDGCTCVIEWVHIVSRAGREERGRVALSGVSAYERNAEGLLCSIRISDYAGYERTIDWSQVSTPEAEAKAINFVETFPPHVGVKSLETH